MAQLTRRSIVVTAFLAPAFLAVAWLIAGTQVLQCQSDQEPKGLPNFGRVTDHLYRGAQPTADGFSTLHAMGVGMVVDFRQNHVEKEKGEVESLGIKFVSIPWSANDGASNAQIVQFLDLVRANPDTKIFVHCRRGADRTGAMIASYRIAVEHESVAQAVSEMHRYHYDWLFSPQLKRYVESLPGLLQNDPQFAAYRPK